jgi:hypothetical protein
MPVGHLQQPSRIGVTGCDGQGLQEATLGVSDIAFLEVHLCSFKIPFNVLRKNEEDARALPMRPQTAPD